MFRRRLDPRLHSNHRTRRRLDKFAVLFLIAALANSLSFNSTAVAGYLATCFEEDGDTTISACTAFLASGVGSSGVKSQAHILRGNAYFKKGNYDQALNDFNKAIKLVPSNPIAVNNRGNIEARLGLYDKAIADYTEAIHWKPEYANAFNNRCFAYNARGRPAQGRPDGNPEGDTEGDYEKAAHDCRRAIALDTGQTNFYVGLGNALNNKKDFDKALQAYDLAIQLDAKNAKAFLGRCSVNIGIKNFNSAIDDCSHAIQLDPTDPVGWNNRCWARAIVEQLKEQLKSALDDCNQALKILDNNPFYLDSRALIFLKMGSFDSAIADYDRALLLQPNETSSLYGRGIAKLNKGDVAGGNDDINAAKQKDKDSSIVDTFRGYGVQ
jgi:tetratricopeptide (TPR) repeat protein